MRLPDRRTMAQFQLPTWRSLRKPLLLVLVFVVVVVVAWTTLINFLTVSRDPQDAVADYLDYLERGSSRQVLAPLSSVRKDPAIQILSNAVYRNAADRPVGHEFVATSVHGNTADVTVDVRTGDGRVHRLTYTVRKLTAWGALNDTWQLQDRDDALVRVRLPAALDSLAVNGQTVRPDDAALRVTDDTPARTWQFEGLPGVYRIGLPEHSYYRAGNAASNRIDIRDPQPIAIDLQIAPSPRMWENVDQEIGRALGHCSSGPLVDAERCPVPGGLGQGGLGQGTPGEARAPSGSAASSSPTARPSDGPRVITNATWELESRPPLVLQPDEQDPLLYHAQRYRPAVAKVTYPDGGRTVTERVPFGIEVSVRSTGDHVEIQVQLRPALTPQERDYRGS